MLTIKDLAVQINAVLAQTTDPAEVTSKVATLAAPYVEDQSWVTPECYDIDDESGIGVRILHRDPVTDLLIVTVCWKPQGGVKPHDHQTWGVVLGLDGEEENTAWRRKDNGDTPGYAELEVAKVWVIRRGDIAKIKKNDIHSVTNVGTTPSLSLHIYGMDIGANDRSEFEPEYNLQRPCPERKSTAA